MNLLQEDKANEDYKEEERKKNAKLQEISSESETETKSEPKNSSDSESEPEPIR